jgi:hypothetical protein
VSAARPVYGDAVVVDERPSPLRNLLPVLILFVGLALATVWYVVVPAFDKPAVVKRSCEVVVLKSGTTACVKDPRLQKRTPNRPTR